MDHKSIKRIHSRNPARRFEVLEPSDLIDPQFLYVPPGGFEWIEGHSGPRRTPQSFLIPKSGPHRPSRGTASFAPPDLYLMFAELSPTPDAALSFANQYGRLGLVQLHFHSQKTPIQSAESWSDWSEAIREFQSCWQAWTLIEEQDRDGLRKFQRARPRSTSNDLIVEAKLDLLLRINAMLHPQRVYPEPCFRTACKPVGISSVRLSPFLTYHLNFKDTDGPTLHTTPIVGRLYPTALISAIWLQLAEVVTGSRYLRRCEKCGKWMDITESKRKGAKRMHENCSLALRMARYRHKKQAAK
jgi:hypothetical protein